MKAASSVLIAVAAVSLMGAGRQPIYLGVLEPPIQTGLESPPFRVRIAFRFENGRWNAMPHDVADQNALAKIATEFPRRVSWTIVLDGNNLGRVESTRPSAYSLYADVGTENLTANSKPPAIQKWRRRIRDLDGPASLPAAGRCLRTE